MSVVPTSDLSDIVPTHLQSQVFVDQRVSIVQIRIRERLLCVIYEDSLLVGRRQSNTIDIQLQWRSVHLPIVRS